MIDHSPAIDYIRAMRSKAKKAYAVAYLRWIIDGEQGDGPSSDGLSIMAAQAVRMSLHELVPGPTAN